MITGFNTDIEHDGVVYHVQTEDKGLETPLILSLVYSGGAILASKRARYEDLIASGFSDEALSERLTRQHKLICAAIHAGRIEDLKRMSASPVSEAAPPPGATEPEAEPQPELEAEAQPELEAEPQLELEAEAQLELEAEPEAELEAEPQLEILRGGEELEALQSDVFDAGQGKPAALEAEASFDETADLTMEETLSSPTGPLYPPETISEQQRRQSVMGDLPASTDGLRITLLGRQEFRSGESPIVKVMVGFRTGIHETPIGKAAVSVKVLGTTFRPQLYSAKTTSDGVAAVATKIPSFTSGRAAILIRAVFNGQQTELRRVIHPGT